MGCSEGRRWSSHSASPMAVPAAAPSSETRRCSREARDRGGHRRGRRGRRPGAGGRHGRHRPGGGSGVPAVRRQPGQDRAASFLRAVARPPDDQPALSRDARHPGVRRHGARLWHGHRRHHHPGHRQRASLRPRPAAARHRPRARIPLPRGRAASLHRPPRPVAAHDQGTLRLVRAARAAAGSDPQTGRLHPLHPLWPMRLRVSHGSQVGQPPVPRASDDPRCQACHPGHSRAGSH